MLPALPLGAASGGRFNLLQGDNCYRRPSRCRMKAPTFHSAASVHVTDRQAGGQNPNVTRGVWGCGLTSVPRENKKRNKNVSASSCFAPTARQKVKWGFCDVIAETLLKREKPQNPVNFFSPAPLWHEAKGFAVKDYETVEWGSLMSCIDNSVVDASFFFSFIYISVDGGRVAASFKRLK